MNTVQDDEVLRLMRVPKKVRAYRMPRPLKRSRIIGAAFRPDAGHRSPTSGFVTGTWDAPEWPTRGFWNELHAWLQYVEAVKLLAAEYAKDHRARVLVMHE